MFLCVPVGFSLYVQFACVDSSYRPEIPKRHEAAGLHDRDKYFICQVSQRC